MKALIILSWALVSNFAMAGDHTLNASSRATFSQIDNDIAKTGTPSSSSFQIEYLNLTLAGILSPSVKYEVMADFLESNPNSTKDSVNGTTQFIEEAYITKSFTDSNWMTFGKMPINFGSIENFYAEYDIYTPSMFWNNIPNNEVGVAFAHTIGDHKLEVQYFNGNKENGNKTNPPANQQSKFGYSLYYQGKYLNGMIFPVIGYTVIPQGTSAVRANKGDDVYLSGGVQLNTPHNIILELDYDMLTKQDAASPKNDIKISSLVANVKYSAGNFTPFLKVIFDTQKSGTSTELEDKTYDLGVEYKENSEQTFKYFAHYIYKNSDDLVNSIKSTPQTMALGIVFDAAILK